MTVVPNFILLVILVVGLCAVVAALVGWDRYRPGRGGGSPGAHPTGEVFIDPETGRRVRVWYDPATGGREYHEE